MDNDGQQDFEIWQKGVNRNSTDCLLKIVFLKTSQKCNQKTRLISFHVIILSPCILGLAPILITHFMK